MQPSVGNEQSDVVPQKLQGHTFSISRRYTPKGILGTGSYGVVCSAWDAKTNKKIAVKRLRPMAGDEWDARHTLREIRLMRLLSFHPNIISSYSLSINEPKEELYIMLELMDCDLHYLIGTGQPLTENHYKCFLKQMLEGLKAMHALKILHRDLKPANILVSKDCKLRITDFGLARYMDDNTQQGKNTSHPMTEYVVTRWYRAPELLLGSNFQYSTAIDVWSVGCIFAELIRRSPLFPGKAHAHQVQVIMQVIGSVEPSTLEFPIEEAAAKFLRRQRYTPIPFARLVPDATAPAVDLIERILRMNPSSRVTVEEALEHSYLEKAPEMYEYANIQFPEPIDESLFAFEQRDHNVKELTSMIRSEVELMSCSTESERLCVNSDLPNSNRHSIAHDDKLAESCGSTACVSSASDGTSVSGEEAATTARRYTRADSVATEDMHFRRSQDSQSDASRPSSTTPPAACEPVQTTTQAKTRRPVLQSTANTTHQQIHQQKTSKQGQRTRSISTENLPSASNSNRRRSMSEHAIDVKNTNSEPERRHTTMVTRTRRQSNERQSQNEHTTRMRLPRILSRLFRNSSSRRQESVRQNNN